MHERPYDTDTLRHMDAQAHPPGHSLCFQGFAHWGVIIVSPTSCHYRVLISKFAFKGTKTALASYLLWQARADLSTEFILLRCCAIDSTCDSSADTRNALICESLFQIFENALLSNGSNLYKLKKLFHANPPELASINYYLELDFNWLNNSDIDDFEGSGTSGELPLCSCSGSSILNQTIYHTPLWLDHHWCVHFHPPGSS